jgi:uncharacterized Zn finger protein
MDSKTKIIDVPCPRCGRPTQETVGMLERASTVICAHCGHVIEINRERSRDLLDAAARKAPDERS